MDTGISTLNPIANLTSIKESQTIVTSNQIHDAEETTVLSIGILFSLFFIVLNEITL